MGSNCTSSSLSVLHAGAPPFPGISPGDIYREIGAGRRPSTQGCCSGDVYVLKSACVVWLLIWGMHGRSVLPRLSAEFFSYNAAGSTHPLIGHSLAVCRMTWSR